jgi:5-methylcytosine-specific restriction endonuclease McrA
MTSKSDRAVLTSLAQDVFLRLSERKYETAIQLRRKGPSELSDALTDGWVIDLGRLKSKKCHLQIWLDRFTRYDNRTIWYGFYSSGELSFIELLAHRSQKDLGKAIRLSDVDLENPAQDDSLFRRKLPKANLGYPIIEEYEYGGNYFYGVYEPETLSQTVSWQQGLGERVAAFFETVACGLPDAAPSGIENSAYPRNENRKIVRQHIQRERNGYLAILRKQKDEFKCQVCRMRFEDVYGPIGRDFAEAHHIVPLSKIKGATLTRVDDLITVCSNCHRMLHRLDGEQGDLQKLKKMVKQQQSKVRTHRSV